MPDEAEVSEMTGGLERLGGRGMVSNSFEQFVDALIESVDLGTEHARAGSG
jgi:hypothetical protein